MSILKKIPVGLFTTVAVCSVINAQAQGAQPHILVYKTKKDYSKYVAVELSKDRKTVVYYPAPSDMAGAANLKPIKLHSGYLLSKAGITTSTAYLNITTTAYGKLKQAPTEAAMLKMIKASAPVTVLCDCGTRGTYTEEQLNDLIDKGQLRTKCKKIK